MIRDAHRAPDSIPSIQGATPPWRITLRGSRSMQFQPNEKVAVVGAAAWCNVRVQTPQIPKVGCLLYNSGGRVLCYDLTRSRSSSLQEFVQDAEFTFRDVPLKLEFSALPAAPTETVFPELEFRRHRATQRRVLTTPVTTLGNGRPSRLQLPGSRLDPCHAAIIWSNHSLTLVDLSDAAGDDTQERIHVLRLGQSLLFHDIEVRFARICRMDELTASTAPLAGPAQYRTRALETIRQTSQPVEAMVLQNMRQRSYSELWQRKAMLLVGALPLCAIAAILFYRLLNLLAPHL